MSNQVVVLLFYQLLSSADLIKTKIFLTDNLLVKTMEVIELIFLLKLVWFEEIILYQLKVWFFCLFSWFSLFFTLVISFFSWFDKQNSDGQFSRQNDGVIEFLVWFDEIFLIIKKADFTLAILVLRNYDVRVSKTGTQDFSMLY